MSFDPLLVDWTRALGWTLIHTLWQGALVAAGYALLRALTRTSDARLRYASGLFALAIMLLLPAITLWQLAPLAGASTLSAESMMSAAGWAERIDALLPLVVLAWLAGVLLVAAREGWRWAAMRALLLGSASALPEWTERAAHVARRLKVSRPVRVVASTLARTPSLIGWLAPVIVLPASTLLALSPRQLEMVIAHELAHVRRADYLVNLLQVAVETLLFHHPAVHWISRDVRELREACCDDLVLRSGVDPLHYADTLACLEELRGITHAPALAVTGGSLLLRVRRIVGVAGDVPARIDGQVVVVCAGLLAVVLGFAGQQRAADAAAPIAAPQIAIEMLSRSAVAALGAVTAVPAVALPARPVTRPAVPPAPIAVASAPVVTRTSAPVAAIEAAASGLPAPRILIALADPELSAHAVAVDNLQARRRMVRPLMVLANDPPINCVRALGSRLCRALPKDDPTAPAEAARGVMLDGGSAVRDQLLRARAVQRAID